MQVVTGYAWLRISMHIGYLDIKMNKPKISLWREHEVAYIL